MRLTKLEEFYKFVESSGRVLLNKPNSYKRSKAIIKCDDCDNNIEKLPISFMNVKNFKCDICFKEIKSKVAKEINLKKATIEFKNFLEENGSNLRSEYKGSSHPVRFSCISCKGEGKKTPAAIRRKKSGLNCDKCNLKRYIKNRSKYDIDWYRRRASDWGAKLLTSEGTFYMSKKLRFICKCGKWYAIYKSNFQPKKERGKVNYRPIRCKACFLKEGTLKGEKNPRWNPDLTKEERAGDSRTYGRGRKSLKWKINMIYLYNRTCVLSGERRKICIHHLNSWRDFKEQRYMLNNGVCLSKSIHEDFHSKYGYGSNTKEQFIEYLEKYHPNKKEEVILKISKLPNREPFWEELD